VSVSRAGAASFVVLPYLALARIIPTLKGPLRKLDSLLKDYLTANDDDECLNHRATLSPASVRVELENDQSTTKSPRWELQ
jgi:hypothetical protein